MVKRLTPKQEAFVRFYIETGNASEAYRRAYSTGRMKPETINRSAHALLENHKITARLAELQTKSAEVHEITVDRLTEMAMAAYQLAMKEDVCMPAAAISAVVALGKLHGKIIDKKHVTGDHKVTHVTQPVSATADWLTGVLGRGQDSALPKPVLN